MRRGYGLSYDGWLDAPYNEDSAECCECGDEISGEVIVSEDENGNEYPYCEECYNADREKVYTFSVTMELTLVGRGTDEAEALQDALEEFDVIEHGNIGKSTVLEWEYDD